MAPKTMNNVLDQPASEGAEGSRNDGGHANNAAAIIEKVSAPVEASSTNLQKSVTVEDVIGGGGVNQPPAELDSETRVLKSVESIDLNEGMPDIDEETSQVFRDIVAVDLAARASAAIRGDAAASRRLTNPEMERLNSTRTTGNSLLSETLTVGDLDNKKKKTHRKTQSVEQRLFGLTNKYAQMKTNGSHRGSSSSFGVYSASSDPLTKAANVLTEHAKDEIEDRKDDIEAQQKQEQAPSTDAGSGSEEKELGSGKLGDASTSAKHKNHMAKLGAEVKDEMDAQYQVFNEFWGERKARARQYLRRLFMYIVIPCLCIAAILHYGCGNPIATGGNFVPVVNGVPQNQQYASVAWWFIFLGVRQPITLTLAFITQALIIDFYVLRTRALMKWVGPLGTLFFVQARGWPFVAVCWGCWNFALLWGPTRISDHWLFWQDAIHLFNSYNQAGNITHSFTNTLFQVLLIIVGLAVAIKRVLVSLWLGKQAFAHYGEVLADNMKNMVLIGSVATLARNIEKANNSGLDEPASSTGRGGGALQDLVAAEASAHEQLEKEKPATPNAVDAAKTFIENQTTVNQSNRTRGGQFTKSEQLKMTELLDSWEDTTTAQEKTEKKISIGSVLQFRQAVTVMNAKYPFTPAFGIADTREACVESAQQVYNRLLLRTPGETVLPFETLALVAKDADDDLDEETAKALIKMFRPDREGNLTVLDFVKSIDNVYKSCRLLSANISNSRNTDAAVESIVNFVFWFFIITFVMSEIGIDPWAILLSLSSIIIALSFAVGGSLAKYMEGMFFILFQRPYGVGDRVHFSSPANETSIDGSSGWIVEKLSLTTTSLYWGATNERATIANGALSNFRVINSARSPNAQLYVNLKFAVDTPYDKLETFRAATEQYLKDRPREWLAFNGFRPTEVAVDRGYINYMIIAQHRCSWQEIGPILGSKAELVKFCMEVAKQLDMRYMSPPLPVDLTIKGNNVAPGEIGPQEIIGLAP